MDSLPLLAVLFEGEAAPAVDAADAGPAALHRHLLAAGPELRWIYCQSKIQRLELDQWDTRTRQFTGISERTVPRFRELTYSGQRERKRWS